MSHTPGEWEVHPHTAKDSFIVMARDEAGRFDVAYAPFINETPDPKATAYANARLVAAAPELLAALKALMPYVRGSDSFSWEVDAAIAAINKAEGVA